jgi:hypothetical protein
VSDERDGACASCGAPMAGDQRWCLECGSRRAGLTAPVSLGATAPPTAPGPPKGRDRASLTFVAVVACLLVALALGVLIGRSRGTPATARGPAPREVITVSVPAVGGTPAPVATTTEPAPAPEQTTTTTTPKPTTTTPPPATTTPDASDEPDVPEGDKDTPVGDGTEATEIG